MTARPDFYRLHNGQQSVLPFEDAEYVARLAELRERMDAQGAAAAVFTSMHNIAYYSGFLYCAFGRPYACVVTDEACVTISAGIDAGQPWRRCYGDNITYTDWQRDNFWRAVREVTGEGAVIGVESDHLTLLQQSKLEDFLKPAATVDLYETTMRQRMHKSPAEIALIRHGAQVADVGGYAIRDAIKVGGAKLTWPWLAGMRWNSRSLNAFRMQNTATPGSGSNLGSIRMARITLSPAAFWNVAISCLSTPFR